MVTSSTIPNDRRQCEWDQAAAMTSN